MAYNFPNAPNPGLSRPMQMPPTGQRRPVPLFTGSSGGTNNPMAGAPDARGSLNPDINPRLLQLQQRMQNQHGGRQYAPQGGANQMMLSTQQPDLQTIERLMQMLRQAGLESQMDRIPTLAPSAPRPRQPGLPRYAPQGGINPMAQRRGNARIQPGLGR